MQLTSDQIQQDENEVQEQDKIIYQNSRNQIKSTKSLSNLNQKQNNFRNVCEYFSRFIGTKTQKQINQQDPSFFNTYIRSNSHRYREKKNYKIQNIIVSKQFAEKFSIKVQQDKKKYIGKAIISGTNANHLGLIPPIQFKQEKNNQMNSVMAKEENKQKKWYNLYGGYIQFFKNKCQFIQEKFVSKMTQNKLICKSWSQYPCLLIYPKFSQGKLDKTYFKKKQFYLCQLFMCMFVAQCVFLARKRGWPIQVVIRSSFGHLLPSVAEMGQCFRFSPGVIPQEFLVEVVIPALYQTQTEIKQLLDKKISLTEDQFKQLKGNLIKVGNENNTIKYECSYLQLLLSKASSSNSGKCFLGQFFRMSFYFDYFVNCILKNKSQKSKLSVDTASVIHHFIKKFNQSVTYQIAQNKQKNKQQQRPKFSIQSQKKIETQFSKFQKYQVTLPKQKKINDLNYKSMIGNILYGLNCFDFLDWKFDESDFNKSQYFEKKENISKYFNQFYQTVQQLMRNRLSNFSVILQNQKNSSQFIPSKKIIDPNKLNEYKNLHRKVIVSSGMAAITLSILASGLQIQQNLRQNKNTNKNKNIPSKKQKIYVDSQNTYYQTIHFFNVFKGYEKWENQNQRCQIFLYDLNPISTVIKQQQGILSKRLEVAFGEKKNLKMIIFDVTSSSQKQINQAFKYCFSSYVKNKFPELLTIMTVSSGLKLSQLGFDLVQWGQIRIWDFIDNYKQNSRRNYAELMQDKLIQLLKMEEFYYCRVPQSILKIRKIFQKMHATLSSKKALEDIPKLKLNFQIYRQTQGLNTQENFLNRKRAKSQPESESKKK